MSSKLFSNVPQTVDEIDANFIPSAFERANRVKMKQKTSGHGGYERDKIRNFMELRNRTLRRYAQHSANSIKNIQLGVKYETNIFLTKFDMKINGCFQA